MLSWRDALEIGFVVLGSLGGGGAIVLALSGYLGRAWADRFAEEQRLDSERSLTKLRGDVDAGLRGRHTFANSSAGVRLAASFEYPAAQSRADHKARSTAGYSADRRGAPAPVGAISRTPHSSLARLLLPAQPRLTEPVWPRSAH